MIGKIVPNGRIYAQKLTIIKIKKKQNQSLSFYLLKLLVLFRFVPVCMCVLLEKAAFVFQQWYTSTMNLLGTWLTDRMDLQLHLYQLKILIRIVKVIYI